MKCSDPRKEILAWLLKRRTSMRDTWIAELMQLGHSRRVCPLVRSVQTTLDGPGARLRLDISASFEDRAQAYCWMLIFNG